MAKISACWFLTLVLVSLRVLLNAIPTMAQMEPPEEICLSDVAGDVNQDGHATPGDALQAFQHFLGLASLSGCAQIRGNVLDDMSSGITPGDALCIFQHFMGLQSCLDSLPSGLTAFVEGIYLLRGDVLGNWTPTQLQDVAGFTLRPNWRDLEPTPDHYDWARVTTFIIDAVDTFRKKVTLHISNGVEAPLWLYSPPYNVPPFFFLQGQICPDGRQCFLPALMPVPWHETYLSRYEQLLQAFATLLRQLGTSPVTGTPYAEEVVLVHFVGPTLGGAEIFLPAEDDGSVDARRNAAQGFEGGVHAYVHEWQTVGYTPETAYGAFRRLIDSYAAIFPGKYVAFHTTPQYLQDHETFDADGDGEPETYPAGVLEAVVNYGVQTLGGRATIQADNLNPRTVVRDDYQRVLAVHRDQQGTIIGFQTELPHKRQELGGTFRQLLDNGLSFGAQYIEVYAADLLANPADILYARTSLDEL